MESDPLTTDLDRVTVNYGSAADDLVSAGERRAE